MSQAFPTKQQNSSTQEWVTRIAFFLPALLFPVFSAAQEQDCVLKKDQDGVKVYICKSDSSKFRSLKAEFDVADATIEQLRAFLFDVPGYLKWQYKVIEADMVKQLSDEEMIYRVVIDAPWPLDNRENIVKVSTIIHDRDRADFNISRFESDLPEQEGLVRIPFCTANWTISRISGLLHVTYAMSIHPGGNVPAWLVNMAMADGPHQSFRDLKKMLEKGKK